MPTALTLKNKGSYNQIIKSTTIFGGSQVFTIIIGVVRTKIVAILLGTTGVGIIGIYSSIIDIFRTACGLGMDTAGVKEIAEINTSEDKTLIDKTIIRFNRWFLGSAIVGLIGCILFCYPISLWVFGSAEYAIYIALLSVSVFLAILTTGRSSVLQGMRRIGDMAKSNIIAAVIGLLVAVPLYYFFRIKAIPIVFIITYLVSYICVEFYYKKLGIAPIKITNREALSAGKDTLKLGLYIVIGGFVGTAAMFIVRAYITRNIDLDAAGLFQAAWVITNVYLGLVLRSMGTDFFPRLSAVASDNAKVKQLVNEQTYVVLVVASPVIVAMLLFSDFALSLLYSSDFAYATTVLKWQVLGTFLKVLSWPIAFILLAKNKGLLFLISEVLFYAAYLLSAYFLFPKYGLDATGIGYLIAYIVYLPVVFFMGRSIAGFGWDSNISRMILINTFFAVLAFRISHYYTGNLSFVFGCLVFIASIIYAYFKLKAIFSLSDIKSWFKSKKDN